MCPKRWNGSRSSPGGGPSYGKEARIPARREDEAWQTVRRRKGGNRKNLAPMPSRPVPTRPPPTRKEDFRAPQRNTGGDLEEEEDWDAYGGRVEEPFQYPRLLQPWHVGYITQQRKLQREQEKLRKLRGDAERVELGMVGSTPWAEGQFPPLRAPNNRGTGQLKSPLQSLCEEAARATGRDWGVRGTSGPDHRVHVPPPPLGGAPGPVPPVAADESGSAGEAPPVDQGREEGAAGVAGFEKEVKPEKDSRNPESVLHDPSHGEVHSAVQEEVLLRPSSPTVPSRPLEPTTTAPASRDPGKDAASATAPDGGNGDQSPGSQRAGEDGASRATARGGGCRSDSDAITAVSGRQHIDSHPVVPASLVAVNTIDRLPPSGSRNVGEGGRRGAERGGSNNKILRGGEAVRRGTDDPQSWAEDAVVSVPDSGKPGRAPRQDGGRTSYARTLRRGLEDRPPALVINVRDKYGINGPRPHHLPLPPFSPRVRNDKDRGGRGNGGREREPPESPIFDDNDGGGEWQVVTRRRRGPYGAHRGRRRGTPSVTQLATLLALLRATAISATYHHEAGSPSVMQAALHPEEDEWSRQPGLVPFDELRAEQLRQEDELTREPRSTNTLPLDKLTFMGYDCARPYNVTTMTMDRLQDYCLSETSEAAIKPITYTLLQRTQRTRFVVQKCRVTRTKMVYGCGTHSHSSLAPPEWRVEEEVPYSVHDCLELWGSRRKDNRATFTYRMYRDERRRQRPFTEAKEVTLNTTSNTHFYLAGSAWPDSQKNDYNCKGGRYYFTHHRYTAADHMMQVDVVKVDTEEVEATIDDDGSVVIHRTQLRLPCNGFKEKGCSVKDYGTFIWTPPTEKESCPYYKSREVKGWQTIEDNGDKLFISDEDSMVRLKVGDAIGACNGVVYPTDYSKVFLTLNNPEQAPAFHRPLHESEMSILLYANQQDSFLYHRLLDKIKERLKEDAGQRCQRQKWRRENAFAIQAAEQHAIQDGETVRIALNQFVTASGNVWYHYKCRPRLVTAREADGCYSSLPVQMSPADFATYQNERRGPDGSPISDTNQVFTALDNKFFLEPKSHRIITTAIPSTCGTPLVPQYQNTEGTWIRYNEKVFSVAPNPIMMERIQWDIPSNIEDKPLQFEKGGVYTHEQILRLDRYNQNPHIGVAVASSVAQHLTAPPPYQGSQPSSSSWFVPEIPKLEFFQGFSKLGWLWDLIKYYGNICSIVVASALIWRATTWIGGVFLRLITIPLTGNLCLHILSAFCPSLREFLKAPASCFASCVAYLRGANWPPSGRNGNGERAERPSRESTPPPEPGAGKRTRRKSDDDPSGSDSGEYRRADSPDPDQDVVCDQPKSDSSTSPKTPPPPPVRRTGGKSALEESISRLTRRETLDPLRMDQDPAPVDAETRETPPPPFSSLHSPSAPTETISSPNSPSSSLRQRMTATSTLPSSKTQKGSVRFDTPTTSAFVTPSRMTEERTRTGQLFSSAVDTLTMAAEGAAATAAASAGTAVWKAAAEEREKELWKRGILTGVGAHSSAPGGAEENRSIQIPTDGLSDASRRAAHQALNLNLNLNQPALTSFLPPPFPLNDPRDVRTKGKDEITSGTGGEANPTETTPFLTQ